MGRIRQAAAIIHQAFVTSTITEPATFVTTVAPIATTVAGPTVIGESCANLSVPIGNETMPMQSARTMPVPVTSQIMKSVRLNGQGTRTTYSTRNAVPMCSQGITASVPNSYLNPLAPTFVPRSQNSNPAYCAPPSQCAPQGQYAPYQYQNQLHHSAP